MFERNGSVSVVSGPNPVDQLKKVQELNQQSRDLMNPNKRRTIRDASPTGLGGGIDSSALQGFRTVMGSLFGGGSTPSTGVKKPGC